MAHVDPDYTLNNRKVMVQVAAKITVNESIINLIEQHGLSAECIL